MAAEERQGAAVSSIDRREVKVYDRMLKVTEEGVETDVASDVESEECDVLFRETKWLSTGDLEEDCSFEFVVSRLDNQPGPSSKKTGCHMTYPAAERNAKLDDDVQSLDSDCKLPIKRKVNGTLVSQDESCLSPCRKTVEDDFCDKYLIFTMGEKTYTPHQIGIKRILGAKAKEIIERLKQRETKQPNANSLEDPLQQMENDRFDSVDHMIELHGHIIGMCLSPDHR